MANRLTGLKVQIKRVAKSVIPYKHRFRLRGSYRWLFGKMGILCELKYDINLPNAELVGNEAYGAFYVYMPKLTEEKPPIILSLGIGEDVSFDKDIIRRAKAKVYAFDPTPRSVEYLKNQKMPSSFEFFECAVGAKDGYTSFCVPAPDSEDPSGSIHGEVHENGKQELIKVEVRRISTIIKELGIREISLLKMDIEGSEFEVIDDMLKEKIYPNQICLEFHERFFRDGKSKMRNALKNLRSNGYALFAISTSRLEVSFIKREIIKKSIS